MSTLLKETASLLLHVECICARHPLLNARTVVIDLLDHPVRQVMVVMEEVVAVATT